VLILVDVQTIVNGVSGKDRMVTDAWPSPLSEATRETDIIGWYLDNSLMAVIGTELGKASNEVVQKRFLEKLRSIFESTLGKRECDHLRLVPLFPEEYGSGSERPLGKHQALPRKFKSARTQEKFRWRLSAPLIWLGALRRLFFLSPLFAAVAMADQGFFQGPSAVQARAPWPAWKDFYRIEVPFNEDGLRCKNSPTICRAIHRRPGGWQFWGSREGGV